MNIEICRKSSQMSQSSFSIFILFLLRFPSQFIGMLIVCIEDEIGENASNITVAQQPNFSHKIYVLRACEFPWHRTPIGYAMWAQFSVNGMGHNCNTEA